MLKEIVIEAVIFVVMTFMAHVIGLRKVKLVDRPIEGYLVEPPVRKRARMKHAIALRGQFARRNRWADIESESLISLPSVTFNWTIGVIAGTVMMILFVTNHLDGIAELGRAADHWIGYDYMVAFGGMFLLCFGIAAWFAEKVIPDAAKLRANQIAHNRLKKGRTARFVQELSADEIMMFLKWVIEEEKAKKAHTRKHESRKLKKEIISLLRMPVAACHR